MFDVMHSRATDRRSASKCQGKWPDQTLERRSDGLECWKPSTPRICVTSSSGNGYNPRLFGAHPGNPGELVIDTVVCLTLAKWETVSGQFGGYLTTPWPSTNG